MITINLKKPKVARFFMRLTDRCHPVEKKSLLAQDDSYQSGIVHDGSC